MKFIVRFMMLMLWVVSCYAEPLTFENHQLIQLYTHDLAKDYKPFPKSAPFDEGYLKVSKLHKIYYAQYGNPKGKPVVYVHGGPGAGTSPDAVQFFDPDYYRIILFDQRGAGKSQPHGLMEENTLPHLVDDLVALKKHLKIKKWLVSGGSWGSTLALAYAQAHPKHVHGLILRGIFDGTADQYLHLIYGMKKTYPEAWAEFVYYLPEQERGNLIRAYYTRLMDSDPSVHMPAAKAFLKYDLICANIHPNMEAIDKMLEDETFVLGISRGFMHYAYNDFFMKKLQIRKGMDAIQDIPIMMVHGRYDTITPPGNAHKLYRKWDNISLLFVQDAGHSAYEKGNTLGLIAAGEKFKQILS